MKTFRWFVVVSLLSLSYCASYAQITIQKSDLQQIFVPGAAVKIYSDTSQFINVGKTGGPNVYDFSSLVFPDSLAYTIYSSSEIPQLAARFDPSSMVWGASTQNIGNSPVTMVTDTGFIQFAEASIFPDSQEYRYDIPYEEPLAFPATYNSQWSTSGGGMGVDTTYVNNVRTVVTTGWNSASNYIIDGFGTLLIKGKSYQCLRRKEVEVDGYTFKGFNFFTGSGLIFLVGSTKDQNDTGVVRATQVNILSFGSAATSVPELKAIPTTLWLSQNYPNPFNPATAIQFTVPTNGRAVLKVFNVLGQEVATIFDGAAKAGEVQHATFDASHLASGIYFSRLEFGGKMEMKKMIVLK
ncbi:MAG TPA: T9SS type A sorting domain-containing protein [Bacteroidota bacterium]|nr:T9SS type A sorting domain-containing protein [Bacteroidota bacterium]